MIRSAVRSSLTTTSLIELTKIEFAPPLIWRSKIALMSLAVTGVSSEYFRPGLSLIVLVRPSADVVIDSASSGCGTPLASWRNRLPWVRMIVLTDTRSPDLVTCRVRTGPAPAILMFSMVSPPALGSALGAADSPLPVLGAATLGAAALGADDGADD